MTFNFNTVADDVTETTSTTVVGTPVGGGGGSGVTTIPGPSIPGGSSISTSIPNQLTSDAGSGSNATNSLSNPLGLRVKPVNYGVNHISWNTPLDSFPWIDYKIVRKYGGFATGETLSLDVYAKTLQSGTATLTLTNTFELDEQMYIKVMDVGVEFDGEYFINKNTISSTPGYLVESVTVINKSISVTSGSSGASTITLDNTTGLVLGLQVSGTGIASGAFITAINTSTNVVTLSAANTATVTGNATFAGTTITYDVPSTATVSATALTSGLGSIEVWAYSQVVADFKNTSLFVGVTLPTTVAGQVTIDSFDGGGSIKIGDKPGDPEPGTKNTGPLWFGGRNNTKFNPAGDEIGSRQTYYIKSDKKITYNGKVWDTVIANEYRYLALPSNYCNPTIGFSGGYSHPYLLDQLKADENTKIISQTTGPVESINYDVVYSNVPTSFKSNNRTLKLSYFRNYNSSRTPDVDDDETYIDFDSEVDSDYPNFGNSSGPGPGPLGYFPTLTGDGKGFDVGLYASPYQVAYDFFGPGQHAYPVIIMHNTFEHVIEEKERNRGNCGTGYAVGDQMQIDLNNALLKNPNYTNFTSVPTFYNASGTPVTTLTIEVTGIQNISSYEFDLPVPPQGFSGQLGIADDPPGYSRLIIPGTAYVRDAIQGKFILVGGDIIEVPGWNKSDSDSRNDDDTDDDVESGRTKKVYKGISPYSTTSADGYGATFVFLFKQGANVVVTETTEVIPESEANSNRASGLVRTRKENKTYTYPTFRLVGVQVADPGNDYKAGDTFLIKGSDLGYISKDADKLAADRTFLGVSDITLTVKDVKDGKIELESPVTPITVSEQYLNVPAVYVSPNTGSGSGATFDVYRKGLSGTAIPVTEVFINNPGTGYADGDIITIDASLIGTAARGATDLDITLDQVVTSTGAIDTFVYGDTLLTAPYSDWYELDSVPNGGVISKTTLEYDVTNKQITSTSPVNIATLTLDTSSAPHLLKAGDYIVVESVGSPFNGIKLLTSVTATTISFEQNDPTVSFTSATGTVELLIKYPDVRASTAYYKGTNPGNGARFDVYRRSSGAIYSVVKTRPGKNYSSKDLLIIPSSSIGYSKHDETRYGISAENHMYDLGKNVAFDLPNPKFKSSFHQGKEIYYSIIMRYPREKFNIPVYEYNNATPVNTSYGSYVQALEPFGNVAHASVKDHGTLQWLLQHIPQTYLDIDNGDLIAFLRIIAFKIDEMKTDIDFIFNRSNPSKTSMKLVDLALKQLGIYDESVNRFGLNKRALVNAIKLYKSKGSTEGVKRALSLYNRPGQGLTNRVTADFKYSKNKILDENSAAFEDGTGFWQPNISIPIVTKKKLQTNVATLTVTPGILPLPIEFPVGTSIVVAGVDATFNGTYTVTIVTDTTISYAKTATNVTETTATGTVVRGSTSGGQVYGYGYDTSANTKALSLVNARGTVTPYYGVNCAKLTNTMSTAQVVSVVYGPKAIRFTSTANSDSLTSTYPLSYAEVDEYIFNDSNFELNTQVESVSSGTITINQPALSASTGGIAYLSKSVKDVNGALSAYIPVVQNLPYVFEIRAQRDISNTDTIKVGIIWRNYNGTVIGFNEGTSVTKSGMSAGVWTQVSVLAKAPVNAIYAQPYITASLAANSGTERFFYIDGVTFSQPEDVLTASYVTSPTNLVTMTIRNNGGTYSAGKSIIVSGVGPAFDGSYSIASGSTVDGISTITYTPTASAANVTAKPNVGYINVTSTDVQKPHNVTAYLDFVEDTADKAKAISSLQMASKENYLLSTPSVTTQASYVKSAGIYAASRSSSTATIYLSYDVSTAIFSIGERVLVSGLSNSAFNGEFTITNVGTATIGAGTYRTVQYTTSTSGTISISTGQAGRIESQKIYNAKSPLVLSTLSSDGITEVVRKSGEVTKRSLTGNVATLTIPDHRYVIGDKIIVTGVQEGTTPSATQAYNSTTPEGYTITSTTYNSVSYALTGTDEAEVELDTPGASKSRVYKLVYKTEKAESVMVAPGQLVTITGFSTNTLLNVVRAVVVEANFDGQHTRFTVELPSMASTTADAGTAGIGYFINGLTDKLTVLPYDVTVFDA